VKVPTDMGLPPSRKEKKSKRDSATRQRYGIKIGGRDRFAKGVFSQTSKGRVKPKIGEGKDFLKPAGQLNRGHLLDAAITNELRLQVSRTLLRPTTRGTNN